MADEEDLRRVRDGMRDLVRCDLRQARFEGLDLRGRDFSSALLNQATFNNCNLTGSNFSNATISQTVFSNCDCSSSQFFGAVVHANFSGSDLRDARMQGVYNSCKFDNADLRSADFSGANFQDLSTFQDVQFNDKTDFEGSQGLRALSRLPVFQNFIYDRGKFARKNEIGNTQSSAAYEEGIDRDVNRAFIAKQISRNNDNARGMANALAMAIKDQIESLPIPNEAKAFERYTNFVEILNEVCAGLAEIGRHLDAEQNGTQAAGVVADLFSRLSGWLGANKEVVASYGIKTGLLGAGCAFLTFCGAPPLMSFPALAFMLEGKTVVEALRNQKAEN